MHNPGNKIIWRTMVFIIIIFLLQGWGAAATASPVPAVRFEPVAGDGGATVELKVFIDNPSGMAGGQLSLTFDPALAGVNRVEPGSLLQDFIFMPNLERADAGIIRAGWAGTGGLTTGGLLCSVFFDLHETATILPLVDELELFRVDGSPIAPEQKTIILKLGIAKASVGGEIRSLDGAPYLNKTAGRTLVPVRFVSEILGANVKWLAESRQVLIKDQKNEILLTENSAEVFVNGTPQKLDCPAEMSQSRIFVPLRFVSENLGALVKWDAATETITITER